MPRNCHRACQSWTICCFIERVLEKVLRDIDWHRPLPLFSRPISITSRPGFVTLTAIILKLARAVLYERCGRVVRCIHFAPRCTLRPEVFGFLQSEKEDLWNIPSPAPRWSRLASDEPILALKRRPAVAKAREELAPAEKQLPQSFRMVGFHNTSQYAFRLDLGHYYTEADDMELSSRRRTLWSASVDD